MLHQNDRRGSLSRSGSVDQAQQFGQSHEAGDVEQPWLRHARKACDTVSLAQNMRWRSKFEACAHLVPRSSSLVNLEAMGG